MILRLPGGSRKSKLTDLGLELAKLHSSWAKHSATLTQNTSDDTGEPI